MNNLILYTTECPKCKILERKLAEKGIVYTKCTDTNLMLSLGIQHAPVLSIDDKMLDFSEALNWIRGI